MTFIVDHLELVLGTVGSVGSVFSLMALPTTQERDMQVSFVVLESLKVWFCVAGGLLHNSIAGRGHPQQPHESRPGAGGEAAFSTV